jgi:predicted RNA-binding protein YlqC (UPF0109 family)
MVKMSSQQMESVDDTPYTTPGEFNPPEGPPASELPISLRHSQVARLIGKDGAYFIEITDKSGAKYIWYDSKTSKILIWGSPEACLLAERLVRQRIDYVTRTLTLDPPTATFKIDLDPKHIGRLIGTNRSNLIGIQTSSGADDIRYMNKGNEVHVWGSPAACCLAEKLVRKAIKDIVDRHAKGPPTTSSPPTITFRLEIDPRNIGHLIGAKGSNLLRVREMSGARFIKYSSEDSEVRVWGTPEACSRAEALIRQKVASLA